MVNEWSEVELRELVEMSTDKIETKSIPEKCYVSTDSMLPDFGGVSFNGAIPSVAKTSSFSIDDVLFSNIRTYFRKLWIADRNGGCSNDVIVFRPKKHVHPRFLFYSLMDERFIRHTVQTSKGTKMPRGDKSAIIQYKTKLPPLPEQKAIADILGSLDDKIELNRRMNETLEGIAQALFKSWFVDFDPVLDNAILAGNSIPDEFAQRAEVRRKVLAQNQPSLNLFQRERGFPDLGKDAADFPTIGNKSSNVRKLFPDSFQTSELGPIPAGWEMQTLSDLLDVKYGKDHKKLADGNIPVYGSGGLMRHAEKSLYTGESVLIPRKGTLNNILYLNEEFWTVDTMFYTIPKTDYVAKYAFCHLKGLDFSSMNVGSAVPSMTTKVLNALSLIMPAEAELQTFDSILQLYFDRAEANNTQSKTLAKLRDTLLPKLISGELRIEDCEKMVGEGL